MRDEIEEKEKPLRIQLKSHWDAENSALLTKKIYEVLEEHKLKANIKIKPGSLDVVTTLLVAGALYPIIKDVVLLIIRNIRKERQLPPVKIRVIRRVTVEEIIEETET